MVFYRFCWNFIFYIKKDLIYITNFDFCENYPIHYYEDVEKGWHDWNKEKEIVIKLKAEGKIKFLEDELY